MSDEWGIMSKLAQVGLTEGEGRVYLALLKSKAELDAKNVSKASGIPYSKVYTVLEKLASKSLITVRAGRPTVFGAKPPSDGLSEYKRQVARELEGKFGELEAALQDLQATTDAERPDIWIIKNTGDIIKKANATIHNATKEVDVALPFMPEWASEELYPTFLRLRGKEISLKLLLSSQVSSDKLEWISGMVSVRTRDRMFGGGIIVDGKEAILFIASEGSNPSVAIWSNHVGLVQIAKTYFDNLWASSTTIN
ncbi:MAG: TrmB family transcriptional regulator [Candidatus Methanosuratincola sp.]|jgi:sugar-specific transcriptional regulator TrmB|nr:helix-turn-helix domain-containing protein [Candidatus Methanosuratincola sp.]